MFQDIYAYSSTIRYVHMVYAIKEFSFRTREGTRKPPRTES